MSPQPAIEAALSSVDLGVYGRSLWHKSVNYADYCDSFKGSFRFVFCMNVSIRHKNNCWFVHLKCGQHELVFRFD